MRWWGTRTGPSSARWPECRSGWRGRRGEPRPAAGGPEARRCRSRRAVDLARIRPVNAPYRTVLIGCGPRGRQHALGFRANEPRFALTAVCDLDPQRLASLADELGIVRRYADAETMLASEAPDVLCFATPCAVRLPLVELGVAHGVRAIALEKPLAPSLSEARRIVDVCAAAGVKGVVCHQLRHATHWQRAKE